MPSQDIKRVAVTTRMVSKGRGKHAKVAGGRGRRGKQRVIPSSCMLPLQCTKSLTTVVILSLILLLNMEHFSRGATCRESMKHKEGNDFYDKVWRDSDASEA